MSKQMVRIITARPYKVNAVATILTLVLEVRGLNLSREPDKIVFLGLCC
jgi:hypothetical protein